MRGGIRIGTIWGVPLYADVGALFLLGLFTWITSARYGLVSEQLALPFGLVTGIILSLSILLHELAHTFVARSLGIQVKQVALSLSGGFTEMDREFQRPWSAFAVSIIGPLVTIAFGLGMLLAANELGFPNLIGRITPALRTDPAQIGDLKATMGVGRILSALMCQEVAQLNIVWGLFNLLPFFPLDGGQVMRAVLWKLSGDRLKSSIWAAQVGQVCGTGLIILGLFILFSAGTFDSLWLMLIGWLIANTAGAKVQISSLQQALLSVTCENAMTRDFRIIDAQISLREFADRYLLLEEKSPLFVANLNGRDRGLVQVENMRNIDRNAWDQVNVLEIVKPIADLDTAQLQQSLAQVIQILENKQLRSLTVLSPVGSIAGVIDRGDILMALARKLQWRIPENFVKQIKSEGRFPPDFRIAEISTQLVDETIEK
jgi:Zn-dependent protease